VSLLIITTPVNMFTPLHSTAAALLGKVRRSGVHYSRASIIKAAATDTKLKERYTGGFLAVGFLSIFPVNSYT